MSRKSFSLLLAVVMAAGAAACSTVPTTTEAAPSDVSSAPVVDVPAVRVSRAVVESALEVSGTLAARSRVGLKPRLPGRLERVLVDVGDRVAAGQVVATIDRREVDAQADAAEAAVAVAKAAFESAEAALAHAATERTRAQSLFEAGAIARQRLDGAETAHRAATAQRDLARANIAQAEAALRRAREVQRDATLTSPVAGFVVARNYDPGAIPGEQPVVVVADVRQLKLEAGVSELEAGRLKPGMTAAVRVQAKPHEPFAGELVAIVPEVNERNRHFGIEIRVPNDGGSLLAGMYATARFVAARAEAAAVVPREAVTTRDGKRVVLKITGQEVSVVEVSEGVTDGQRVQILSGLTEGDQVMADARRQLPAGARVRAVVTH